MVQFVIAFKYDLKIHFGVSFSLKRKVSDCAAYASRHYSQCFASVQL